MARASEAEDYGDLFDALQAIPRTDAAFDADALMRAAFAARLRFGTDELRALRAEASASVRADAREMQARRRAAAD